MYDTADHDQDVVEFINDHFLLLAEWMRGLESFIFVKRGSHKLPHDVFLPELLSWMFKIDDERKPCRLERLWVQEYLASDVLDDQHLSGIQRVKSILLGDHLRIDIDHPRFHRLQHVGGIGFSELVHLPDLKYVRGYCVDEKVFGFNLKFNSRGKIVQYSFRV